jgi:hypothetical protein
VNIFSASDLRAVDWPDVSEYEFFFTRASELLLILRARTWRRPNQLFVKKLE